MELATVLNYPIIVIPDLHGQRGSLDRLVSRLERLDAWPDSSLMFLGDFVDRGPDVPGCVDRVLELLRRPAGGSAVMGNHDLALVRAAQLDDGPPSPYWIERYRDLYDCETTVSGYLGHGHGPGSAEDWIQTLAALKQAMPPEHSHFLANLPWLVQAPGHLFLHCGLSTELEAGLEDQLEALRLKRWDRESLRPRPGSATDLLWNEEYPVWIGADRKLSSNPQPYPGKLQVTGHVKVARPELNAARLRLDTSGGFGTLTACLLESAEAAPSFFTA